MCNAFSSPAHNQLIQDQLATGRYVVSPAAREDLNTTPLVKYPAGRLTRNFNNFHYLEIPEQHYRGPRAILVGRYKLVVNGKSKVETANELLDVRNDPAEQHNLFESKPQIAKDLQQQLRNWRQSVLHSLTGTNYR